MTTIHDAIVRKDVAALEELLTSGGAINTIMCDDGDAFLFREELNVPDSRGRTALHLAAIANKEQGGPAMMRLLLDAGADVSACDDECRTALLTMIQEVKDTMIIRAKVLLEFGVDVNAPDIYGNTALSATWERAEDPDSEPLMLLLLDHGADPNLRIEKQERNTLLHWAVKHGNRRLVNRLIQHGADPNLKNSKGHTPLHLAAGNYGSGLSIMAVLLEAGGADPCVFDEKGLTPLMVVCSLKYSFLERIDVLLDYVATPKTLYINAHDKSGWTALMHAAKSMYGATKALHLLELGADPFQRDKNGSTVLIEIVKNAYSDAALEVVAKLPRGRSRPQYFRQMGQDGPSSSVAEKTTPRASSVPFALSWSGRLQARSGWISSIVSCVPTK